MTLIEKAEARDDDLIRRGDIGPRLAEVGFGGELLQAAIAALPAAVPGVKPLVWGDDGNGGFIARGVGRTYNVHRLALDPGTWGAVGVGDTSANADDVKAACDRANTAIVLSALAPTDAAQAREAAEVIAKNGAEATAAAMIQHIAETLRAKGKAVLTTGDDFGAQVLQYADALALIGERP